MIILKEDIELAVVYQFADGIGLMDETHPCFDEVHKQFELRHEETWSTWHLGQYPDVKPYDYINLVLEAWHDNNDTIYTDVFKELTHAHIREIHQGLSREL